MKADYQKVTHKNHTFLSSLIGGLCAIIITLIICVTVLAVYGMNLAGEKSEEFFSFVQSTIKEIPEVMESLPPITADLLNDRRDPNYRDQLDITVEPTLLRKSGKLGASIQIVNKGSEVVSLLSLRVVILDQNNEIFGEFNEWLVTPFAVKDNWAGPLLPDSNRFLTASGRKASTVSNLSELKAEYEITELRVWNGQAENLPTDANMAW